MRISYKDIEIERLHTRIEKLTIHLKLNTKDNSSKRSLMKLVGKKRRLSKYKNKCSG